MWTHFRTSANSHDESECDDNRSLLPLWSDFAPTAGNGGILWTTDIETHWKLRLDFVDVELGREFWTSKYLTFRPHVGLRLLWVKQEYEIDHSGGSWEKNDDPSSPPYNNKVELDNNYHGVGLRTGIDTVWNFGRGWAFFGNIAAAIVYGRFNVDHEEDNRQARSPHDKDPLLETEDNFRVSRATTDVTLGIQWSSMFSNCRYGFTAKLGWEHHLFFDQNQMWRVMRIGDSPAIQPNPSGENVYHQRRGDLSTQGWTLTFVFEF